VRREARAQNQDLRARVGTQPAREAAVCAWEHTRSRGGGVGGGMRARALSARALAKEAAVARERQQDEVFGGEVDGVARRVGVLPRHEEEGRGEEERLAKQGERETARDGA